MRITGFGIDGFGIFSETEVTGFGPGLVVFHGANEAGKSTCLAFVHAILFGFPDGRTKSQMQYPPLRGGSHGGRLFVSSDQYREAVIERRPGVRGGPVTLTTGDEKGDGEGLARILQGVNLTLYRNLYGFSLTELQNLATLTDDEVKDIIYGASFGGGAQSFSQAVKTLTSKRTDLFKPKGRRSEINRFLNEIKDVRDELKEAARDLISFEQESERLKNIDNEIAELRSTIEAQRSLAKRSELHLMLWDDWLGLKVAREEFLALPKLEGIFPDDGLTRLGDLQLRLRTEEKNVRQAVGELESAKAKLSQLDYDEAIMAAAGDIKTLVRGLETYENNRGDLGRIEDREKSAHSAVNEIVSSFGPGWSEERALGVDRSAPAIDKIEGLRRDAEQALNLEEKLGERVSQLLESRKERKIELADDEKKLEVLGDPGVEIDRSSLEILRERREQYAGVLRDIPRRLADRDDKQGDLKDLLKEIDPTWTEDHLDGLSFSISTRERAQSIEDGLSSAQARISVARSENDHRLERVDEVRLLVTSLTQKRDEIGIAEGSEDCDLLREKLRLLRRLAAKREYAVGELEHLSERLHDVRSSVSMLKGSGLLLPALGAVAFLMFEFQGQRALGVAFFSVLLAFGVTLFMGARRRGARTAELTLQVDEAESQIEEADQQIPALKTESGIEGEVDSNVLDDADDRLDSNLLRGESVRRLTLEIGEAEERLTRREKQRNQAEEELEQALSEAAVCQHEWSDFITEFGLDERMTPRIFERVLARAAAAQQVIKEIGLHSDRIKKMEAIRGEYLEAAGALPQLENEDPEKLIAAVDRLYAELLTRDQLRTEIEIAGRSREESRIRYARATEQLRLAETELKKAVVLRCAADENWSCFLDEHGFDASWSGSTVRDMLGRFEHLSREVARRDEALSERQRLGETIEDFKTRAVLLFDSIKRPADVLERELASEIRTIGEILDSAIVISSTLRATTEDIENRQRSLDTQQVEVQRLLEDLRLLFSEAGVEDEAGFRERAGLFEKSTNIEVEIAGRESRVRTISGETDIAAIEVELQMENKPDLQARCEQLKLEIKDRDERLVQHMHASAKAGSERKRLASDDRVAELRAKEERLAEEIRERAFHWSRYAIAAHLLDTAKARFEESHQPEVIQYATRFFSEITGGRYKKVFAPHGEDQIDVVDAHGKRFSAEVLSRGTQEQLYLAIRFGYIRAREKNAEPLPIIMDDVLVNFDPDRARRAAEAIAEMATTNQVLFFTCHPSTVDVFRAVDPSVVVYELEDGKIRR